MDDNPDRSYVRKLKRHDVSVAVEVVDAINSRTIGRLVNLHTEGLMMVGEQELPSNNLYQFELHLPEDFPGDKIIAVGVDCLWSRSNSEGTLFWAGCKIIDISDAALAELEKLIQFIAA